MLRREAIVWLLRLSGVTSTAVLLDACRREPGPGTPDTEEGRSASPPAERADDGAFLRGTLRLSAAAMVARLLPPVDGLPGGVETGVVEFIDRELRQPHLAPVARFVRKGLVYLRRVAEKERGASFHRLAPEAQDALLSKFQTGAVQGLRYPSGRFFDAMLTLALEGHYGDPKYGGNQGRRTWAPLGIDPHCPHEPDRTP
jgi:gluconate 2-dehydrogenase gamma chain